MSRQPKTCEDCARRKIKCDKVIPCNNCTKRGSAHLCRRADVTHSGAERRGPFPPSKPMSLGLHDFQSPSVPRRQDADSPISERILGLMTTLSERVKHLETKLDSLEPRKRSAPDGPVGNDSIAHVRPLKQARITQSDTPRAILGLRDDELASVENDSSSVQNSSDEEDAAKDAATVLEFLAWGRLKDSNLTSGFRGAPGSHDSVTYHERDIIQTTQAWGLSPSSISASHMTMETLQISQIQEMLPNQEQVMLLFDYHADWLLFMHCSFHVQTFRKELKQFYTNDHGIISRTSSGLQWAALLFAIICGSMACAKPSHVSKWGFNQDDQSVFAKQWYQASIECLNTARYQQNHSLYSVQTIASSTICAHILGFSNSQSVLLASAVRVAHSLGLHRLARPKKGAHEADMDNLSETIQKEVGRRVWLQLATQDWFSVPFSETYCVNPLHFTTKPPLHCDEDTMQPLSPPIPTITSYCNFLHRVASLMPALQDRISQAQPNAKYDQVLHFDRLMRDLVTTQLPSCLNSQTPVDQSWPPFITLARRCLTITSAHKIIMIHRKFLGMSFHDKRFVFTRRTCLAAAKTIINEMKEDTEEEFPNIWTTQAFSVAAAIILSLDNFNRHQSAREYAEHRQLVSQAIEYLSASASVSSIASRGARLLTELLAEEQNVNPQNGDGSHSQKGKQMAADSSAHSNSSERSLNVAAFVKKFCESDLPQPGNSPIATSHMPLWLQQDNSSHSMPNHQRIADYSVSRENDQYSRFNSNSPQQLYDNMLDSGYQIPLTARRHHESFATAFGHNVGEPFDVRSLNWFDDLLGLAPSHSI